MERRLAAILAADVAEYSLHLERDTTATVSAWQSARDGVMDPSVAEFEGRVVKLTGDGFLAEFPTVEAAVKCAISIQERLHSNPLQFRIGVSIGDIIDDGKDIYGEGINIAARLESLAEPGGILISGEAFNLVRNRISEDFLDLGNQNVKHVSQPVRTYALARFTHSRSLENQASKNLAKGLVAGLPGGRFSIKAIAAGASVIGVIAIVVLFIAWGNPAGQSTAPQESGTETSDPDLALLEAARHALSPGDRFKDCETCPVMTVVPAGFFRMGWDNGDPDEKPVHEVTVPAAFAVSTYEITFSEWEACIADNGCNSYRPDDHGWGRASRPVINVSWLDAQTYIAWLVQRTGKKYRLLTEAEWEYVARGGSSDLYPWGVAIDAAKANYGLFRGKTMPVGSYEPNGFGLFDVTGNVWEWVNDCYEKDAYSNFGGYPLAYLENSETCKRVVRGGSWNTDMSDGPTLMRTSIRWRGASNGRYNHFGFRVARDLE
jgi:formylglycine-generating enzyme required for sulfatase activity